MNPISLVGSTYAIAAHSLNVFYRYNEVAEAKNLLLSLDISLLRLQKWQNHWFKQSTYNRSTAEKLWGTNGTSEIEETIGKINQMVSQLGETLGKVNEKETSTANGKDGIALPPKLTKEVTKAFRDMDQRKRGHRRFVRFFKKSLIRSVQNTTRELSSMVDELEQLSSLSYQTLHRMQAFKNRDGFREYVLRSILSRQGALNLWDRCRRNKYQCSLGIDMLLDKGTVTPLHVATQKDGNGALCYRLLWTMDESYGFMILADTLNVHENDPKLESDEESVESYIHDFILQKPNDREFVKLCSKYSRQPSRFRVAEINRQISPPQIAKYSNSQGLEQVKSSFKTNLFTSLPIKEKIKLAYKLSECGAELLGTPWFASLVYSGIDHVWLQRDPSMMEEFKASLRRGKESTSEQKKSQIFEKDLYTLDVPRVKIDDLIVQDSGMLAEHHQLFRLGVLLIQLALGPKMTTDPETIHDQTAWASKVLPLVSRELGNQYAEACAFCVGTPRRGHWESNHCDKYARTEELESWKDYLESFIGDFYSEVYLRSAAFSLFPYPIARTFLQIEATSQHVFVLLCILTYYADYTILQMSWKILAI